MKKTDYSEIENTRIDFSLKFVLTILLKIDIDLEFKINRYILL